MSDSKHQPMSGATVIATSSKPGTPPPGGPPPPPPAAASEAPPPSDSLVGSILSERYRILKRLGEGGMGTVYLAEHTTINKKLALKVLSPEYSHKQDLVDRFLQEARAASMIDQENVVEITDYGSTPNGSVYFVMEYLQGEDLSDTVKREGALPWDRVRPIMVQICRALQAAHDRGIIHRDMKPENCYRIKRGGNQDFIKVLDFGIAKVTSEEGEGGKGLTRTGMIFGTPEYMSPEQAKGERPDHRVDVYAAGVIMYELLTGRVPFTADTFMGILTKHMFEAPPAPSAVAPHANIPSEVEAIILKALQKDREYRFQNMADMQVAVEAVGTGSAAVSVIAEQIAQPASGRIGFDAAYPSAGTYPPGTYPPGTGELAAPSSSKGVLIGGVAVIALLGIGVGAFAMMGGEETAPETDPVEVAAVVPPPTPVPTPEPEPRKEPVQKVVAAQAPKVTFKISTPGVDAHILDARDEGSYGKTNSAEGVSVEKSDKELKLILRAPGYEDLLFPIIPDRDKTFTKALEKKKVVTAPKRPSKKEAAKTEPKTTTTTTTPTPIPTKPKEEPRKTGPVVNSPDLKDPFKKNK